VLSYLLLIAVMGLARLCTVLWRRQRVDEANAMQVDDADSEGDAAGDAHLDRFADSYGLTNRERDIFALFAEGRSAPYIAEMLVLSENTVKTHLRHIYTKCNLHNRQELLDAIEAFKQ
jgi:DNA-binding NarL/FixJ family response regulator